MWRIDLQFPPDLLAGGHTPITSTPPVVKFYLELTLDIEKIYYFSLYVLYNPTHIYIFLFTYDSSSSW